MTKKPQVTIALSALIPNEANPRKISDEALARLKKSISDDPKFMELRPIIVDEQMVIIGGNQRYRALRELGKRSVPVSWVKVAHGLTKEQRRRFIVIDNAPEGMAGYWDFAQLKTDWTLEDLEKIGFLFPQDVDIEKEWEGLPEFENKEFKGYKELKVYFLKEEHYKKFIKLVGQFGMTKDTKYIWYPKQKFDALNAKKEYRA